MELEEREPFNLLGGPVLNSVVMLTGLHLDLDETSSRCGVSDPAAFCSQFIWHYTWHQNVIFLHPKTDHMLIPCLNGVQMHKQRFSLLAGHLVAHPSPLQDINTVCSTLICFAQRSFQLCWSQMRFIRLNYEYTKEDKKSCTLIFSWVDQFVSYIYLITCFIVSCHTKWQQQDGELGWPLLFSALSTLLEEVEVCIVVAVLLSCIVTAQTALEMINCSLRLVLDD